MQFNSIEFFIFLTTIIILINCIRKSYHQQLLLIGASYLFYWTTSNYFILLLLFVTAISFQAGETIYHTNHPIQKKIILIFTLICLLIPLAFFKYYNFGIGILNQILYNHTLLPDFPILELILPIGISFFTFSAISYVIDIYNDTIQPEENFFKYALFISYFPHLLAGPIVRAGQFLPQLKSRISINQENVKIGITLMMWGFVKKFVIADSCAPIVNEIFSNPTEFTSFYIIYATILFGIQIYCDFSGYIDIALGAAELIGFHLPQNFFRPYLSKNPTEFWRRWNITLSKFIRDYVYIPLGGNRKGKIRTYFNIEFSMLLCGLWHGAAWNFLIWGGYHGILQSAYKFIVDKTESFPKILPSLNDNFKLFLQIVITQYFIFLGWIMFRVSNFSEMIFCITKFILIDFDFSRPKYSIFGITTILDWFATLGSFIKFFIIISVLLSIILLIHNRFFMKTMSNILTTDWTHAISSLPLKYWIIYLTSTIFILLCFTPSSSPEFIYYQF